MPKHIINLFSKLSRYCFLKSMIMLIAGVLFSIIISPDDSMAQGDLLITPRRVIFEGSKRSMDLNLASVTLGPNEAQAVKLKLKS